MIISKAEIGNFGKLYGKTIYFSTGLNIVYGENESGKSTLHRFLTGMLFGMEKQRGRSSKNDVYRQYQPWEAPAYYAGALEFQVGGKHFTLERNFYHKEKSVRLYNQEDGEELSVEHGDLEILLGGISKRAYENTCCISQAAIETEKEFSEELKNFLVNAAHGGDTGTDITGAFKRLQLRKKDAEERKRVLEQGRKERMERLQWEQEMIEDDIASLKQKMPSGLWEATKEVPSKVHGENRGNTSPGNVSTGFIYGGTLPFLASGLFLILLHFLGKYLPWNDVLPFMSAFRRFIEVILWVGWLLWIIIWCWKKKVDNRESILAGDVEAKTESEPEPWDAFREQLEEKQIRLENIMEELSELSGMSPEEREACETLEGIQLAMETLKKVTKDLYEEGRDELHASISGIFSGLTGGKYDRVELSEQMNLILYRGERSIEPWNLSRGTLEQLYFSLRLGAGRLMMKEEPMPLLLDEPFCAYDDTRLARTLRWLAAREEQVILFTCRRHEPELAAQMGIDYNKILF